MSVSSFRVSRLQPVAAAAALLFICQAPAQALTTVTAMQATGSYKLDGDAKQLLADIYTAGVTSNTMDVLRFTGSSTGPSSAGLHSYGSTTGDFGSRSSGSGLYDVTGGFSISLTITNDTSTAQNVDFSFFITPGYLNNAVTGMTGSQYVESGASFNLVAGGSTLFSSAAVLRSDTSGTSFTTSGDASLYSGSGLFRNVNGTNKSIDLGVLNAGESIDLTYELTSYAKGDAIGTTTSVPGYTVVVPDQWVMQCSGGGYGYGDTLVERSIVIEGPGSGGGSGSCEEVLVPGYTYEVPGYETGEVGGSGASSGDPFDVDFNGQPIDMGLAAAPVPFGVDFTPAVSAVPEPGTYALMLLGLAGLGAVARRRRSAASSTDTV